MSKVWLGRRKYRCFYKHVTSEGNIRLIELPIKRIVIETTTSGMGPIYWLIPGKTIEALRRVSGQYKSVISYKGPLGPNGRKHSLTPEALSFTSTTPGDSHWWNISNHEYIRYSTMNATKGGQDGN